MSDPIGPLGGLRVVAAAGSDKWRITVRLDGMEAIAPDAFVEQVGRRVVFSGLFALPDGEGVLVAPEVIDGGQAALLTVETPASDIRHPDASRRCDVT